MIDYFTDWQKVTGTFQQLSTANNAAGQPVETWTAITGGSNIKLNYWIDKAVETNSNDKFVDKKVGTVLVPLTSISFTPDTSMRIVIDSKNHFITGVDNIAEFDDFYKISWVLTNV